MKNLFLRILTIFILFIFAFGNILALPVYGSASREYYVNPGARGSDAQSGTVNRPFKTVGRAVQAAAEYLAQNQGATVTICLNDGTYQLTETVEITAADLNGGNLTVKAVEGARPVLSGGKSIVGWELCDAQKNIYSAPLLNANPRQLYINGRRAVRARISGDFLKNNLTTVKSEDGTYTGYKSTSSAPLDWTNAEKIEFVYAAEWANHRCKVSNIVREGNGAVINMVGGFHTLNKISWGTEINDERIWYAENAYEFLDEEREFYVDTAAGKIYYKPAAEEDMQHIEATYPALEHLLFIHSTSSEKRAANISFEDISFMHSAWDGMNLQTARVDNQNNLDVNGMRSDAAVNIEEAEHIRFRGCTFAHTGGDALRFKNGISNCSVEHCSFYDTSAGAVSFGEVSEADILGMDENKRVDNNIIENCIIHDTGIEYAGAAAVTLGAVSNMRIFHNEIYNTSYSGMHIGWGWNNYAEQAVVTKNIQIKYNYLHDIMTTGRIKDGGAVYTLGKNAGGCVTAYNYIKNQYETSSCLYNDEGTNDWITHHNVVDNSGLVWGNGIKPRWMHWHMKTIVRCHMYDNFADSDVDYRNGTDCVMEKLTIVPDGYWPAEAVNIMKNAGVEKRREFFGDVCNDDEEVDVNGSFDYAGTFLEGWITNSKNDYGYERSFENTAGGSVGSLKINVYEGGELAERSVRLRRNSFYHLRAQVKLSDQEGARMSMIPYLKYGEQKVYFEQQTVSRGIWTEIQAYFQPPVAQPSADYSADSLYDDYMFGFDIVKDDDLECDILYLDDAKLYTYSAYYNPNFRNNFEGWDRVSGIASALVDFDAAAEGVSALVETGDFPNVTKVARFSSDSRTCAGIKQNFAFEKNTVYDVSYWVKAGDANGKLSTLAFPLGTNAAFAPQWPYAIWAKTDITDGGWTHISYQVAFGDSADVKAFDSRLEIRYQNSFSAGENATAGSFYMAEFSVKKSKNLMKNPYFLFGSAATRSLDDDDYGAQNRASGLHWETYNSDFQPLNNQEQVCFDGAKACGAFTASAENSFVGQMITIEKAGKYSLSAWVKTTGNARLSIDDVPLAGTVTDCGGWKRISSEMDFERTGTYRIGIKFDTAEQCLFKDVSVILQQEKPRVNRLCVLDAGDFPIADYSGIYQDMSGMTAINVRGSILSDNDVLLIVAGYSGEGRAEFVQTETVAAVESADFEKTFSLPGAESFSALNLLLWDSRGNMVPIGDVLMIRQAKTDMEQQ